MLTDHAESWKQKLKEVKSVHSRRCIYPDKNDYQMNIIGEGVFLPFVLTVYE